LRRAVWTVWFLSPRCVIDMM